MKKHKGIIPYDAAYTRFGEVIVDGVMWLIFIKKMLDWPCVKVLCKGRIPGKANYHLNYNGTRFSHGDNYFALSTYRPTLLAAVEAALKAAPIGTFPLGP